MAGIRDEIDPDLLCSHGRGSVDHAHERGALAEIPDDHAPGATDCADPGNVDLTRTALQNMLQRIWMPDCEPDIASFDATPEDRLGTFVSEADGQSFDDESRLFQRIN